MSGLLQDLRYALRRLRKNSRFSGAVVIGRSEDTR